MNKKFLSAVAILALSFATLTGCGQKTNKNLPNENINRPMNQSSMKRGEIDSIDGNTVTVKLIEQPQRPNEREGDKMPPKEGQPRQPKQRPEGNKNENQGQRNRPEIKYTGETVSIQITESIKIYRTKFSKDSMGREEISVTDLKKGDMVGIGYNSDQSEITYIQLMGMNRQN